MSKMSQIHAELSEQASDLGFESIADAEANGYHIAYYGNTVKLMLDQNKAHELAHKDWEKRKKEVIGDLMNLLIHQVFDHDIIKRAIDFIKEGEC